MTPRYYGMAENSKGGVLGKFKQISAIPAPQTMKHAILVFDIDNLIGQRASSYGNFVDRVHDLRRAGALHQTSSSKQNNILKDVSRPQARKCLQIVLSSIVQRNNDSESCCRTVKHAAFDCICVTGLTSPPPQGIGDRTKTGDLRLCSI